jgi:hypothetical protein
MWALVESGHPQEPAYPPTPPHDPVRGRTTCHTSPQPFGILGHHVPCCLSEWINSITKRVHLLVEPQPHLLNRLGRVLTMQIHWLLLGYMRTGPLCPAIWLPGHDGCGKRPSSDFSPVANSCRPCPYVRSNEERGSMITYSHKPMYSREPTIHVPT